MSKKTKIFMSGRASGKSLLHEDENGNVYISPSLFENDEITPLEALEALEKIDHTVCLAFNDNNQALFNKDNETHIDCKDIDEFCDCYEIIETALKDLEWLKSKLDIDFINRLSDPEDKIRLLKIMGLEVEINE